MRNLIAVFAVLVLVGCEMPIGPDKITTTQASVVQPAASTPVTATPVSTPAATPTSTPATTAVTEPVVAKSISFTTPPTSIWSEKVDLTYNVTYTDDSVVTKTKTFTAKEAGVMTCSVTVDDVTKSVDVTANDWRLVGTTWKYATATSDVKLIFNENGIGTSNTKVIANGVIIMNSNKNFSWSTAGNTGVIYGNITSSYSFDTGTMGVYVKQ